MALVAQKLTAEEKIKVNDAINKLDLTLKELKNSNRGK